MASIRQYNYSLDMAQSTVSELFNVFPFNVEKGLLDAMAGVLLILAFIAVILLAVIAFKK